MIIVLSVYTNIPLNEFYIGCVKSLGSAQKQNKKIWRIVLGARGASRFFCVCVMKN